MQFNSESNNQDLYSEARYWCGIAVTDTSLLPIATFTRGANFVLDRVTALIFRSDKKWRWDDSNRTDLPSAYTSLVANQRDYSIPSSHLKIEDVKIKDANGNWISLDRMTSEQIADQIVAHPDAGTPTAYGVKGNSIFFDRAPSYSSSGGMRVYPQRGASYFAVTDTTKEPGFASPFHRLVALGPARDYCAINGMGGRQAAIEREILKLEAELMEFYSERAEEGPANVGLQEENYGQDV